MTSKILDCDSLRFIGFATAATSALTVFAYMIFRLQSVLLGVPPDMLNSSPISNANAGVALVASLLFSGALVVFPVVSAARVVGRIRERWKFSSAVTISWLGVAVAAGATIFVLGMPFLALSKLKGLLWRHGNELDTDAAGILPLIIGKNSFEPYLISGLALGAIVLTATVLIVLVLAWRRQQNRAPVRVVVAGVLVCVAFPSFMFIVASMSTPPLLGKGGPFPAVTIHMQPLASVPDPTIEGDLISQSDAAIFVLSTTDSAAFASTISRRVVVRIDYRTPEKPMNEILRKRLECEECNKMSVTILKLDFLDFQKWALIAVLLLVVGFGLVMPNPASAQTSDRSGYDNAATATILSPTFVTHIQSFFSAVGQTADDVIRMVNEFQSSFRGEGELSSDLWMYSEASGHRRLTTDGGYRSPRPSRDGSLVAFLRNGHPGILDVASGNVQLVPGETSYEHLFGWDEKKRMLLVDKGGGILIRLNIVDGHPEPMADSSASKQQLAALETLARMTPSPGVYLVRESGGVWAVMEKRWGVTYNDRKFTRNHPVAEPTWCAAGIVYVEAGE